MSSSAFLLQLLTPDPSYFAGVAYEHLYLLGLTCWSCLQKSAPGPILLCLCCLQTFVSVSASRSGRVLKKLIQAPSCFAAGVYQHLCWIRPHVLVLFTISNYKPHPFLLVLFRNSVVYYEFTFWACLQTATPSPIRFCCCCFEILLSVKASQSNFVYKQLYQAPPSCAGVSYKH